MESYGKKTGTQKLMSEGERNTIIITIELQMLSSVFRFLFLTVLPTLQSVSALFSFRQQREEPAKDRQVFSLNSQPDFLDGYPGLFLRFYSLLFRFQFLVYLTRSTYEPSIRAFVLNPCLLFQSGST